MARNMSLLSLRKAANIKKGRDTNIAVDAIGSTSFRLIYNAILTKNKDNKSDIEYSEP